MRDCALLNALLEGRDAIGSMASTDGSDPWLDVSNDVISRFMDVLLIEHGLSRRTRMAYGVDLQNLDRWMHARRRTAITAGADDLHQFFSEQAAANTACWLVKRTRSSIRRFYKFLRDLHYRDDDPMEALLVIRARGADAHPGTDLEAAA